MKRTIKPLGSLIVGYVLVIVSIILLIFGITFLSIGLIEDKNFIEAEATVKTIINNEEERYINISFEVDGKKFVYATDVELKATDYQKSTDGEKVFKNADVIVIDSQYTVEEAYRKENWGHSAFCYVIDFAVHYNIKKIYLFHHEPMYDDKKLNSILQAAKWYAQYINHSDVEIEIAKEELEIEI